MQKRSVFAIALTALTALALTGCSAGSSADDGKIRVVASTNVYGDIASTIAGNAVEVTSLMSDPAAVSKADILIENGGGYDDFMGTLRSGSKNTKATVLNVVDLSGKKAENGELNEHVWYDFPTIEKFAAALTDALAKADPSQKATFTKNADAFSAKLAALQNREAGLKTKYAGEGAAITEPVPLYMLDAIGLVDKTPEKFSAAIEGGTDVSPLVLQETLALFSGHQVKLLAYNEQTSGPETERVLAAAKQAGIPVVPVTETLPKGKDYIGWMNANLDAVESALAQ